MDQKIKDIIDQLPGTCGFKDSNSLYGYTNGQLASMASIHYDYDVIGKSADEILADFPDTARLIREHDLEVVRNKKTLNLLYIYRSNDGQLTAHLVNKSPFIDRDTGEVAGITFNGIEVSYTPIVDVGSSLLNISKLSDSKFVSEPSIYIFNLNYCFETLTLRQQEVLFFFIRGKTSEFIAKTLDASIRTIYEHIGNLEKKFHVQNRYELIESAIKQGYLNLIPKSFFEVKKLKTPGRLRGRAALDKK